MQIYSCVPRVISGAGCVSALGDEVKRLCGSKVLIVCDEALEALGLVTPLTDSLSAAGLEFAVFGGVQADPDLDLLKESAKVTGGFAPDVVVGLGGGSSLDAAKLISITLTNGGEPDSYYGIGNIPKPGLPMILIPTTAGTGSEVTNISVMGDPKVGLKKAMISDHMYARVAMLDPDLTMGLPPALTATTGMDALVHAIESYTGVRASTFTDTLNLAAIRLIAENLRQAYAHGQDSQAREAMLKASCLSGMAFCNTQNGLDHAMALSIGSRYHLPHGLATAFILPWVMEFNCITNQAKFIEIARAFGEDVECKPNHEAAMLSVKAIKSLLKDLGISYKLGEYGAKEGDFEDIAQAAMSAGQLISNNPRQVTKEEIVKILKANM
jgi:alcohol dehydrogenase class IV